MFRLPTILAVIMATTGLWLMGLSFFEDPEPVPMTPGHESISPIHTTVHAKAVMGMALMTGGVLLFFISARR